MSDVVNLNKARKARDRDQARARAEANRAKFGRTKAEKARDAMATSRVAKIVDGARLDQE